MVAGDLVRMTYISFWARKGGLNNKTPYTQAPMLVLESHKNAIKVITPDGEIITGLKQHYEVINEK